MVFLFLDKIEVIFIVLEVIGRCSLCFKLLLSLICDIFDMEGFFGDWKLDCSFNIWFRFGLFCVGRFMFFVILLLIFFIIILWFIGWCSGKCFLFFLFCLMKLLFLFEMFFFLFLVYICCVGFVVWFNMDDDIGVLNLLVFCRSDFLCWDVCRIEFWSWEFFDVGRFNGVVDIDDILRGFLISLDLFMGDWFLKKDEVGELIIDWLDIGVMVLLFNICVWIGCLEIKGDFILFWNMFMVCNCFILIFWLGFGRIGEFWRLLLSWERLFFFVKLVNFLLFLFFLWLLVRRNFCIILFKIEFLFEFFKVWFRIWWIRCVLFWVGIGLNLLSFLLFKVLLRFLKLLGVFCLYNFVFNDFNKGIILRLWWCFLWIFRKGLLF